jgi:chorismate mutase
VTISPLSDDRKAYLLPGDRTELAAELDRWLLAREKDGTLEKLRLKYFVGNGSSRPSGAGDDDAEAPAQTATPIAALTAAVVERLALMPMVYEAKKRAGKPIEDKAQEAAILDGAQKAVEAEAAAQAGGAAAAPPDPKAVRDLFDALIVIGKDAQQKLADLDARRRPSSVQDRSAKPADAPTTGAPATSAPATGAPATSAPATAAESYSTPRQRVYDLTTELRPAIGRISAKIACILVAMNEPVSQSDARRALGNALTPHEVSSAQIDAMASAIARISTRPSKK